MGSARLPLSLAAAALFTFSTSSPALADGPSPDAAAITPAVGVVGFTISASALFKIKRDGRFKDFDGKVSYDPAHPTNTQVDLTVYTESVDMHNAGQEQLLKSKDFFDVERFPTMHFTSSSAAAKPDGTVVMTGEMTIRGITKQLTVPVKVHHDGGSVAPRGPILETTFQIDRTEFGLNGSPSLSGFKFSISKNVQIHIVMATGLKSYGR